MALLNFKYGQGTPATYEQGTIYVSTDNKKIYVGDPGSASGTGFCAGDFIEVSVTTKGGQVAALQALKGPQQNVLYLTYNADDGYDLWKYSGGTNFVNLTNTGSILELISGLTKAIGDLDTTVKNNNTNITENYLKKVDAPGYDNIMTKAGGTFTGAVTLSGAPSIDLHAATKKYVDEAKAAAIQNTSDNYATKEALNTTNSNISSLSTRMTDVEGVAAAAMPKSGGTFTGPVILSVEGENYPTEDGHVVNKKYVDAQDAATLEAAKGDAASKYATIGTVNTLTSDVNNHIANAEEVYLKKTSLPNIDKIAYTTGATFTGEVILAGEPDKDNEAANKKYVDDVKTYANTTFATKETVNNLDSKVETLKTNIGSLSNIMNFVGVTTSALTDGATTKPIVVSGNNHTQAIGDVVIYNSTEFVWNGTKWEKIGNTSAETAALDALDLRLDNLEGKVKDSSALVTAVDKNTSDIGTLSSDLDNAESNIGDLQDQLTWVPFTSL